MRAGSASAAVIERILNQNARDVGAARVHRRWISACCKSLPRAWCRYRPIALPGNSIPGFARQRAPGMHPRRAERPGCQHRDCSTLARDAAERRIEVYLEQGYELVTAVLAATRKALAVRSTKAPTAWRTTPDCSCGNCRPTWQGGLNPVLSRHPRPRSRPAPDRLFEAFESGSLSTTFVCPQPPEERSHEPSR